jgi:hypothetical protein
MAGFTPADLRNAVMEFGERTRGALPEGAQPTSAQRIGCEQVFTTAQSLQLFPQRLGSVAIYLSL